MPDKKEEAKPEGWQAEKHTSQRVYHYIEGTFSLCGRLGFYTGKLMPHTAGQKKGREDCAECYKRIEKKLAKQKKEGAESNAG